MKALSFKSVTLMLMLPLVVCILLSANLYADTFDLGSITVIGSPVRDSVIHDYSVKKTIIDKAEINNIHSYDISDILKQISGVSVVSEGMFGSRRVGDGRIKIRGNSAKLLLDGRPVSMEVFNCIVGNVMTLNNVERIEIIKGGESVLYGTDGIGGVINIVTTTSEKYQSSLTANYGTFNTKYLNFNTQNKIDEFYYAIGYELKKTEGDILNTKLNSNDYFIKTGYKFSKYFIAEISGKYYDGNNDDPYELVNWDIGKA